MIVDNSLNKSLISKIIKQKDQNQQVKTLKLYIDKD